MTSHNNRRDDDQIYDAKLSIRLSKKLAGEISRQADRSRCSTNEIVRLALTEYLNRTMSDTEFFHASLADMNHRLYRVENKLKKYPALIYALAEEIIRLLPEHSFNVVDISSRMDAFEKRVVEIATKNREGAFETILIDAMEGMESEQ